MSMNFKQERIAKLEAEMQIQQIDEDVWEVGKPLLPNEYFDDVEISECEPIGNGDFNHPNDGFGCW